MTLIATLGSVVQLPVFGQMVSPGSAPVGRFDHCLKCILGFCLLRAEIEFAFNSVFNWVNCRLKFGYCEACANWRSNGADEMFAN